MPFKFNGKSAFLARGRDIAKRFPDRVGPALYQVAQPEMTEAKRRAPVWNPARPVPHGHTPGSLRASGQVHPPERNGRQVSVTLSFGNELVDYAVYVHEDLEAFHAMGQAKFLESTLNESAPFIADRVAALLHLEKAG